MRNLDAPIDVSRMRPRKKRERTFENALRDELKKMRIKFVKTKPTVSGFPDRLAIGFGAMKLVEVKREDETLEKHQEILHEELRRDHGVNVLTVWPPVRTAAKLIRAALV